MRRIVVHLRTCPTRLLGPYGCEWIDTPALNRLAAEAVVFDGHYATRTMDASVSGVYDPAAASLQAASQRPATENHPAISGTSHSYASFVSRFDSNAIAENLKQLSRHETGILAITTSSFALPWPEWESQQTDWNDESSREEFFTACEAKIAAFDEEMSELLEAISQQGLDQSALLVLTAMSSLPLGQHGIIGIAGSRLHEELVHLPLIVRFPDRRLASYRVACYTTPDDLAELLATGSTERLEALILGTQPTRESVISKREDEVSIRTADSCLILPLGDNPNPPLLYDRPDDRFEVNNLAERQSDRVEELKSKIDFTTEGAEDTEKQHNSGS